MEMKRLEIKKEIRPNGKLSVTFKREEKGTIRDKGKRFSFTGVKTSIMELKDNSKNLSGRKFLLVIKRELKDNDYLLSQMNYSEEELIELRNNIDFILDFDKK